MTSSEPGDQARPTSPARAPSPVRAGAQATTAGPWLRAAGDYAWRLLALGTVAYFVVTILSKLSLVVIPFLASIFVTALLYPLMVRLRRGGLPRLLATILTLLIAVVIVGGLITIVVIRAAEQAPQLGNEFNKLLPQIKH